MNDLRKKANTEFNNGNYKKAIDAYFECLEKLLVDKNQNNDQEISVLYSNCAACYLKLNDYTKSLEYCENALKYNQSNIKALYRKCESLKNLEKYEEAFLLAEKQLKSNPNSEKFQEIMRELSQILLEIKRMKCDPVNIAKSLTEEIEKNENVQDDCYKKLYSLCMDKNVNDKMINSKNNFQLLEWLNSDFKVDEILKFSYDCMYKIVINSSQDSFLKVLNYLTPQKLCNFFDSDRIYSDKCFASILIVYQEIIIRLGTENIVGLNKLEDYLNVWIYYENIDKSKKLNSLYLLKRYSTCTINIIKHGFDFVNLENKSFHLKFTNFIVSNVTQYILNLNIFKIDENKKVYLKNLFSILDSNCLLLLKFDLEIYGKKPLEEKSNFTINLKTTVDNFSCSISQIIARFILVKGVPQLYQDFYLDDGQKLLQLILKFIQKQDIDICIHDSGFIVMLHVIIEILICLTGMKRLFSSIIKMDEFDKICVVLAQYFETNNHHENLNLRLLVALVKLDIAKWQYFEQDVNVDKIKDYYYKIVQNFDFLIDEQCDKDNIINLKIDNLICFNTVVSALEFLSFVSLQPEMKQIIVHDELLFSKFFKLSNICKDISIYYKKVKKLNVVEICYFILKIIENLINAQFESKK